MEWTVGRILQIGAALVALTGGLAFAQGYPTQQIRLIVPFAAGGGSDILARIIAEPLSKRLGQSIVVENKPGGGATVAADLVAKSPPDGYTWLFTTAGPQITNPYLMAQLPYNPFKDFAPVAMLAKSVNVLVVHPGVPAKNVRELIDYAKANPGKLNYASVGNGSSSHLTMELLKSTAGIDIVHVPFNGSPPAVTATIQGETQLIFAVMQPLQAQIQAGKLRAIAVTTSKRFPLLPDLPAIAEAGYPGFEALAWNGILVAAGTPRPIVVRLNAEINDILKDPAVKAALNAQGFELIGGAPEDFARLISSESSKWAPVIAKTGAKID
jgi:tripartite-type tricarboxylate transporter receptor subunit TctC